MGLKMIRGQSLRVILLTGISVLVLNACLPEDRSIRQGSSEPERKQALSQHYAQSFMQYSNASLNSFVDSDIWKSGTATEGSLDLTRNVYGNLQLGQSETLFQSAYCEIGGDNTPHHVTWIDQTNNNGEMAIKGLGENVAGVMNSRIKNIMVEDFVGMVDVRNNAIRVTMNNGTVKRLTGTCAGLNIPNDSVVSVVQLSEVENIVTEDRVFRRTLSCPSGQSGSIVERVEGTIINNGNIIVGGDRSYNNEAALISSSDPAWSVISNICTATITDPNVTGATVNSVDVDEGTTTGIPSIPAPPSISLPGLPPVEPPPPPADSGNDGGGYDDDRDGDGNNDNNGGYN